MNIWQFQEALSGRLLAWSTASVLVGSLLARWSDPFWRGVGQQAAGWGAVDGLIALGGRQAARRRQAALPDPTDPGVMAGERDKLARLLWLNAGLDLLYMVGGARLTQRPSSGNRDWRGHGWGIIIQGGFLFIFDIWHGLQLRRRQ